MEIQRSFVVDFVALDLRVASVFLTEAGVLLVDAQLRELLLPLLLLAS